MSIAACLLIYSLTVLVAGPPLLRSLTSAGHAPRLGVAAWLTAIGSVLLMWAALPALVVAEVVARWNGAGILVASCMGWIRSLVTGDAGIAPQITLLAIATAVTFGVAVTSAGLGRRLIRMRTNAHAHAQAVRLVGRRTGDHDVVVVDAAKPAAYAVSGRPSVIVVTSAARALLDERQLAAVLAHERAHLTGHHAALVAALRGLAATFPNLRLMTQGAEEVSRLLEMCADDAAARRHGREPLLTGLITLCGAAPAAALGAADVDVLVRAERLAAQPHPAYSPARAALTSIITLMAAGPLLTAALGWAGALMCG